MVTVFKLADIARPVLVALVWSVLTSCNSIEQSTTQTADPPAIDAALLAQLETTVDTALDTVSQQEIQQRIEQAYALSQNTIYFAFDVDVISADDRAVLFHHANALAGMENRRIRLQGHADERGTEAYNKALGARRANAVLDYLMANGVSPAQIEVVSYGENRPQRTEQTESAYRLNRRVEIIDR